MSIEALTNLAIAVFAFLGFMGLWVALDLIMDKYK
jgi:hypothetical protein